MLPTLSFSLLACAAILTSAVPPPHLDPSEFPRPPLPNDPATNYCSCNKADGHIADRTTSQACPSVHGVYFDAPGTFTNNHYPGCYNKDITLDTASEFNSTCISLGAAEGVCCTGSPPPDGSYVCSHSFTDPPPS
ncbi:hypothetical protein AC578_4650 [Pseudocercospora eumusae]|uniref:Hydrophobin n=1 Tax=Pseudocercospora eumusae TaxID=321146 RepID=A0A139H7A6_9PEZI|nr:hypothetical protein AC578_4650 [Pseudocercospora eumusae]